MEDDRITASSAAAEGAFQALIRTFGLLRRFMESYFSLHGISASQWGVLRTLRRAEKDGLPGLRLTDLGARLLVRPPSVSGVVDRLARLGLVARTASATDLRTRQVSLTDEGRRLLDGAQEGHTARMRRALSALRDEEQVQLQLLLDKIGDHLGTLTGGQRE